MNAPARHTDDPLAVTAALDPAGRMLIRSEEQLAVSTVRVPARRVRLEKFVVTETRTITVQVSHEQVRLVEVDLEGEEAVDAVAAPNLGSADVDRWVTLSEERVVVTTEVVPVERVRLQVTLVHGQREVTDTVRREQVTYERAASSDPVPDLPATAPRHLRTKDTT